MTPTLSRLGGLPRDKGSHGVRVQAVERTDELAAEHLEAVQAAALGTAKIEVELTPGRVGIAGVLAEHIEVRFPIRPAVPIENRLRQRPVKGIALRNAKQPDGRLVDHVGELLQLIVEQAVAELEIELPFDSRNVGDVAKDD